MENEENEMECLHRMIKENIEGLPICKVREEYGPNCENCPDYKECERLEKEWLKVMKFFLK